MFTYTQKLFLPPGRFSKTRRSTLEWMAKRKRTSRRRRTTKRTKRTRKTWKKSRKSKRVFSRTAPAIRKALTYVANNNPGMVRLTRSVLAPSVSVKLPCFYDGAIQSADSGESYAEYSINLSSPTDPFTIASAHQARGFDQWGAMYRQYLVTACSYEINLRPGSVLAVNAASDADAEASDFHTGIGIAPNDTLSALYNDITDWYESPSNKYIKMNPFFAGSALNSSTAATLVAASHKKNYRALNYKGKVDIGACVKYWAAEDDATGTPDLTWPTSYMGVSTAAGQTNPTDSVNLTIILGSKSQHSTPTTGALRLVQLPAFTATIKLVFDVLFNTPIYPQASS